MQTQHALGLLDAATRGIGHPEHYRKFRMQITICKHVPMREDEIASLPQAWHDEIGHSLAGGPVEALDSVGLPEGLVSVLSCENPGKQMLRDERGKSDPDRWLPIGCENCPPCVARNDLMAAIG